MKFSQRIGKAPIKAELEKEGLSIDLKNSLWTLFIEQISNKKSNESIYNYKSGTLELSELGTFYKALWKDFFKHPIDTLEISDFRLYGTEAQTYLRNWYFESTWFEALDFIEFCASKSAFFDDYANRILKLEFSAYRFIDGTLCEISSDEEVLEIKSALHQTKDKFHSITEHLKSALRLLSDKKQPDYRNSIKESISAVESIVKVFTQNNRTTLGQALKLIEKKHQIPGSLKSAFNSLYGFTSDEGGIRHALLDKDMKVGQEEARFMVVTCSAFVNYLIAKVN